MHPLSDDLIELIAKATYTEGFSISLNELLRKLNIPKSEFVLDDIENIQKRLEKLKLEIHPSLSTGDFNSERILRSKHRPKYNEDFAKTEIANIESKDLEFKSSMMFDHKKFKYSPNLPTQEYKSEGVIHSFVKTIAAFFNTGGGVLYIGVDDDGNFIGLEPDCRLLGCKEFDADKWELAFRDFDLALKKWTQKMSGSGRLGKQEQDHGRKENKISEVHRRVQIRGSGTFEEQRKECRTN